MNTAIKPGTFSTTIFTVFNDFYSGESSREHLLQQQRLVANTSFLIDINPDCTQFIICELCVLFPFHFLSVSSFVSPSCRWSVCVSVSVSECVPFCPCASFNSIRRSLMLMVLVFLFSFNCLVAGVVVVAYSFGWRYELYVDLKCKSPYIPYA